MDWETVMIDPNHPDYSNTPVDLSRPQYHYKAIDANTPPLVSIVTPFFNTGAIFLETAQSVFNQSLQQWEWIIVNDGSTLPEALDVLEHYRRLDPRIKIIEHPVNRGLPAARNSGIRASASEFILFLDSDDLLEPTAAEKWFWFLLSHPEFAYVSGYSVGFGDNQYLWQSGFQDQAANLERNRINHILMARKNVVLAVGGYDEDMRSGLEDWEYWIRSASQGFWGASIPEYLHWYRTNQNPTSRWIDLQEAHIATFRDKMRSRYPHLWDNPFPSPHSTVDVALDTLPPELPGQNLISKTNRRLLLIAPWMITGGAEKFNLDLIRQLSDRGWQITLVTTAASPNLWQSNFERYTPDVFPLANFLDWRDYPRFLSYLVESRQFDAALVVASHEGYRLLPYLRLHFPNLPILDYVHFVTSNWMNGGFPRVSIMFQACLDLTIATCQQVKTWMVNEGGRPDRIEICTANVDTNIYSPDPTRRKELRNLWGISDDEVIIIYAGRIEPQKQPAVFAKTMDILKTNGCKFTAIVLGDGSLRGWLVSYLDEHSLDDVVRIEGETSPKQVREAMLAGDIIFLPSENEGIALTLYEGMACGLAPVAADVGGQRELVTPACGYLLQRSDENSEASAYASVLAELIHNPETLYTMGKASRQRVVENFRLEQMGERMETLIDRARQLRQNQPVQPANIDLADALARQSVEYFRARAEANVLQTTADALQARVNNPPMPPASVGTYLYFAVRRMFYPGYRWLINKQAGLVKIKDAFKQHIVRLDTSSRRGR
jgi:glycosyltransferase involved in cell wall biosynthesis/GT2 family glycosyltransferase